VSRQQSILEASILTPEAVGRLAGLPRPDEVAALLAESRSVQGRGSPLGLTVGLADLLHHVGVLLS
jgi:hypothetical protein